MISLLFHLSYDVVDGGNGVAVAVAEEIQDVADGLLLLYLLVAKLQIFLILCSLIRK